MKFSVSKCGLLAAVLIATFVVAGAKPKPRAPRGNPRYRRATAASRDSTQLEDKEASYLATAATPDQLLPPAALVKRISADLKLIRQNFPQIAQISAGRQFALGQVMVLSGITSDQLTKIKANLGPVEQSSLGRFGVLLKFEKPYNPNALSKVLARSEYGEILASPNRISGGSNSIEYTPANKSTGKGAIYVFTEGSGDCFAGCINRDVTEFEVSANGKQVKQVTGMGGGSGARGSRRRLRQAGGG